MNEWLEQQRKLVAWLKAHLKELPNEEKAGQQVVIQVMKEDIRRVETTVKSLTK